VTEHPRIEELRRRVQKDKASIAFAQLAEEYRRAGRFEEAIETCRTGLDHHPGYLSAHVTLGRALIEVGELEQARDELKRVLDAAPENLAALKGLADIHFRRGERQEALVHYRRALEFAPHDPDLEHLVAQISRDLEPDKAPADVPGGLSFEEAMGEFLALDAHPAPAASVPEAAPPPVPAEEGLEPPPATAVPQLPPAPADEPAQPLDASPQESAPFQGQADSPVPPVTPPAPPDRSDRQVQALERWLDAILADRQAHQP
jgi:tetratricopeptide (TPR) repeat protein